ncbi:hypothetical protein NMY22_g1510 [Coprinellus aureogranulatus]|nr:hypothetical protein NMY22_g1510 [Coprinellus aureogranulatus]
MAFSLSDDIVELVVEELSQSSGDRRTRELLSCSLVSRSFVRPSQKALFHNVDIHPRPPKRREGALWDSYQRSLAWAKAINGSPHLSSYVRQITISIRRSKAPLSTGGDSDEGEIARALGNLSMVSGFWLCAAPPRNPSAPIRPALYSSSMTSQMKTALTQIIQNPELRQISLKNVEEVPGYLVLGALRLEKLELTRSEIILDLAMAQTSNSTLAQDLSYSEPLNTLLFNNSPASLPGIDLLLPIFDAPGQLGLRFRRMNTLNLVVCSLKEAAILEKVECLQKLYVKTGPPPAFMGLEYAPPLGNLNPRSFSTLSVLHLTTEFALDPWEDAFMVHDPYIGLCDDLLKNLQELKVLEVTVSFHGGFGDFLADPGNFGPQWGRLAEVLAEPYAFPKLRSVTVSVMLRLDVNGDISQMQDAEELEDILREFVYDEQLSRLRDLEIGGRMIEFSFNVSIEGRYLRCTIVDRSVFDFSRASDFAVCEPKFGLVAGPWTGLSAPGTSPSSSPLLGRRIGRLSEASQAVLVVRGPRDLILSPIIMISSIVALC